MSLHKVIAIHDVKSEIKMSLLRLDFSGLDIYRFGSRLVLLLQLQPWRNADPII